MGKGDRQNIPLPFVILREALVATGYSRREVRQPLSTLSPFLSKGRGSGGWIIGNVVATGKGTKSLFVPLL
jgi:hypothetical protein